MLTKAQRRVLEALMGGGYIAYADGGPRVRGGGYRKGSYWLIEGCSNHVPGSYHCSRISDRVMTQLKGHAYVYDYGDYGISPAGRAALTRP